jgi:hypothetical protein
VLTLFDDDLSFSSLLNDGRDVENDIDVFELEWSELPRCIVNEEDIEVEVVDGVVDDVDIAGREDHLVLGAGFSVVSFEFEDGDVLPPPDNLPANSL